LSAVSLPRSSMVDQVLCTWPRSPGRIHVADGSAALWGSPRFHPHLGLEAWIPEARLHLVFSQQGCLAWKGAIWGSALGVLAALTHTSAGLVDDWQFDQSLLSDGVIQRGEDQQQRPEGAGRTPGQHRGQLLPPAKARCGPWSGRPGRFPDGLRSDQGGVPRGPCIP